MSCRSPPPKPPPPPGAAAAAAAANAATTTTTTATAAIATAAAAAVAAIVAAPAAALTGDAVDDVVELAARDRAVRTGLALVHAHEADLVEAPADDVECLEQARRAIRLHRQLVRDVVDDLLQARVGRRSRGLRRDCVAALGACTFTFTCTVTTAFSGLTAFAAFDGGGGGRSFWSRGRLGLTGARAGLGGSAEGERRELGERLHGTLATPKSLPPPRSPVAFRRTNEKLSRRRSCRWPRPRPTRRR
ncbi:MAG: hypothetical protein KIT31_05645 [Deltaproteobacteria bacterium]|nr:hypothetical protein [Deltaproteobacteria bacterium]